MVFAYNKVIFSILFTTQIHDLHYSGNILSIRPESTVAKPLKLKPASWLPAYEKQPDCSVEPL